MCVRWMLVAGALSLGMARLAPGSEVITFHQENVLGTSLELTVRAGSRLEAEAAERRVLAEIHRLAGIFSNHDPQSVLRQWRRTPVGVPARLPSELLEVLAEAEHWRTISRGAFDPRVSGLSRLWSEAEKADHPPDPDSLRAETEQFNRAPWSLDRQQGTATRRDALPLSLDGIAKGYIVERAVAAGRIAGSGVEGILLNLGGDLRASGAMEVSVGLSPRRDDSDDPSPASRLALREASLSTSGGAYRGFQIGGQWYSHILDPRTGQSVTRVQSASVLAAKGTTADALATLCNVLPPEESLRLVDSVPGASCRIAEQNGRVWLSRGWKGEETWSPQVIPARFLPESNASALWSDQFELVVEFEINRPADAPGGYRRPYVVVWVEDEAGKTVRTLALWVSLGGSGPDQWLPDLRRWYRGENQKELSAKKNLIYTIARPTRPPGKYTLVWDGKDDKGQPAAPGKYTVSVEAVREHGTNGLIRTVVALGELPSQVTLPGNTEIKSATVTVRRKTSTASLER